jgi:hypothetical protein
MARLLTQIQADIDSVRAEMANSETTVRFSDGREVSNRTTDNALKALAALQIELDSATAIAFNSTRPRQIRLSGNSGF